LFVVSKRFADCLDIVVIERGPPCPAELTTGERLLEAADVDHQLEARRSPAQPGAAPAARTVDCKARRCAIARRPRDPNEFGLRSTATAADTAADRRVMINRSNRLPRSQ
jgi:hypothetical protein